MVAAEKPKRRPDQAGESITANFSLHPSISDSPGECPRRRAVWQHASEPTFTKRPETLWWTRRFAGTLDQVGAARRFVTALLADGPHIDDAAWVVGELATNAIRHSNSKLPGEWFEVDVVRTLSRAVISVIDAGGECVPKVGGPERGLNGDFYVAECGRGLYGIGALATRYGTFALDDGRRVVWARLNLGRQEVIGAPS